jgi:acid phosphatase class B
MNLGIDFHDTLSYAPEFFKRLITGWQGKVYIVTGTPPSKREEIEEGLADLGFGPDTYSDILCGFEYEKKNMGLEHFHNMAEHKLKILKEYNIEIFYDDNPYYVNLAKDHGITVFQTIIADKYLDDFAEKDPFFTSNLQKEQFNFLSKLTDKKMCKDCPENT